VSVLVRTSDIYADTDTIDRSALITNPISYILYPISYILHPTSYILHPTSYILHPISHICISYFPDTFFAQFIRDERDLPFVYLSLQLCSTVIPMGVFLYTPVLQGNYTHTHVHTHTHTHTYTYTYTYTVH
jgi:hypothetical protein